MKKFLLVSIVSLALIFTSPFPAQAQSQTQDEETQQLIISLLQQIVALQQQLAILEQQEAANNISETESLITNANNPIAVLSTNLGDIEIELFEDTMPITAGNFKDLSQDGFYDGTKFHRVIKSFMIQGGDPTTKTDDVDRYGTGGPGYYIEDEFISGEYLTNVRGTISMANTGHPNSGGSQFFINVVDNKNLDFDKAPTSSKHPVFGHVVSGMDVVDAIRDAGTNMHDLPIEDVVIESVKIK